MTNEIDYIRMRVEHWDDCNIYGRSKNRAHGELTVCYKDGNKPSGHDWTYLRDILRQGSELNIICPVVREEGLYPELIIYEPDYLVDVTNVARCFSLYAESPLVSLINRLLPNEKTSPILLGLMAGQLLDEELHDDCLSYAESARRFFSHNAMAILGAELDTSFHTEAKRQRENIHRALSMQLPSLVASYDRRQAIVEPSFVCEMLGLQGRMDFLQLDMSLVIEQKSGKAEYVPYASPAAPPRAREEHCVQMLLYMAILKYNYHRLFVAGTGCLNAFLLYSKYQNPLVSMDFSPQLLQRAIRLRNLIAAMDLRLCREGFGVLERLTPGDLNEKGVSGKLWEAFIEPRLSSVLLPVREALPVERLYYLRMLRFVATEHVLSKLGDRAREDYGLASLWRDTLEEKLSAGNIYCRLRLLWPTEAGDMVSHVELAFSDETVCDGSNFRVGDIVMLYPYDVDSEPDVRKTMVFRGTIAQLGERQLRIRLRNEQTDSIVFTRDKARLWAVEHDFLEASFTSLYSGLQAFLSAPQERRDLLMLHRSPETDPSRRLLGDYGDFNELVLREKQAKDLFLIIGPPGTGKTSFGLLYTLKEELLENDSSILLMAYTNRAVDEICGKLCGETDFIRLGSPVSCPEEYRDHLLEERMAEAGTLSGLRRIIGQTRVFVGTVSSLSSCGPLFQAKRFSLAIVDEASQILEPYLVGLMAARHGMLPAIGKFVLIGDHKQLPAVVRQRPVQSAVREPQLHAIGLRDCRLSLFERLLSRYRGDPTVTYLLTRQGRMHKEVAAFPGMSFYGGLLREVPLARQLSLSDVPRLRFIDVTPSDAAPSPKANRAEAEVIACELLAIYQREGSSFCAERTVGVIVPYRNQIATIRVAVAKLHVPALLGVTIDTVERYQGSQRKHIVYGFTVREQGQLRFLTDTAFEEDGQLIDRKLNVAVTRAEDYLVMVGNSAVLCTNALFSRLVDYVRRHGGYEKASQTAFPEKP
ncbi:MAG: DNA2/NAM7 family helicase [Prevotellaceae bacterium]|nr:DNA2/NAM7 family helicase [Prevotellaceae bacterium]